MAESNPVCGCGEPLVCNEAQLDCNPCCRCVPQRLCAVFTAYGCDCDGNAVVLPLQGNDEYAGTLICKSEWLDLRVMLHHENFQCYWRVVSEDFYIDLLFPIGDDQQSCEWPALEFEVAFAECSGTVSITRHELVKLEPRLVDGCEEPFCGVCECTCDRLCATIVDSDCFGQGTLATDCYDCSEGYTWTGSVLCGIKNYSISITLSRDSYTGECVLQGEVTTDYEQYTLEPQIVGGCASIGVEWQLDGGPTLSVECAYCEACETPPPCPGCCEEKHPLTGVWVTAETLNSNPMCQCWDGWSCFLPYLGPTAPGLDCEGYFAGTCASPCPGGGLMSVSFLCGSTNDLEISELFPNPELKLHSCDPFHFCWEYDAEAHAADCNDAHVDYSNGTKIRFCITG